MILELKPLLSPRIIKHCLPLFDEGHYKQAAHEAMIQVEQALKDKSKIAGKEQLYGQSLISALFKFGSKEKHIRLRVPLGEDLQEQAEGYFKGVFSYYRNYTAHDGSQIDKSICARIMIIASELLDLIDASSLSYVDLGGVDGLIKSGVFTSRDQLFALLNFISGYIAVNGDVGGLENELWEKGLEWSQLDAVMELDLVRYHEEDYVPTMEELLLPETTAQILGIFELTDLGWQFIENGKI
mgnify:FL=1